MIMRAKVTEFAEQVNHKNSAPWVGLRGIRLKPLSDMKKCGSGSAEDGAKKALTGDDGERKRPTFRPRR